MYDGAQMATFWRVFASCIFSEPRAAPFTPASEIRTKATPCVEVWQTCNLRRLRLGEEKKKNKSQHKNIMAPLLHRAAIITFYLRRLEEDDDDDDDDDDDEW